MAAVSLRTVSQLRVSSLKDRLERLRSEQKLRFADVRAKSSKRQHFEDELSTWVRSIQEPNLDGSSEGEVRRSDSFNSQGEMRRSGEMRRQDHSDSSNSQSGRCITQPEMQQVKTWAEGKSLVGCLATIDQILPNLAPSLPYDIEQMAALAAQETSLGPSSDEAAAARKAYIRLLRLLHPDKQTSHPNGSVVLCNAVFHVLNSRK